MISVILCTHNRADYLGPALDSVLAQDFTGEFEVLVVANACTDNTAAVVQQRLGDRRVRLVEEVVLGLSRARNTGAQQAQGEILVYLDDDAVASPHWLKALYQTFQDYPQVAIAGGRVRLGWTDEMPRPSWLSDTLAICLGAYDLGNQMQFVDRPDLSPRGLNYAIRRKIWQQIGGFDMRLGRVGTNLLSNEEIVMTERVLHLDHQVAYVPQAEVVHRVMPDRLHRRWFLRRSWWQGVSESYREQCLQQQGNPSCWQGAERLLRGLYLSMKYHRNPVRQFDSLAYAYGQLGYLKATLLRSS